MILVLGEVTAACVLGLKEAHWTAASTVAAGLAAGLAFVLGAALWWLYFDTAGAATTSSLRDAMDDEGEDAAEDEEESTSAFDFYLYGQLPAILGLLVAGVGIEHAVAEAGKDAQPWATLLPMCVGIALYLLALAGTQAALRAAASRNTLWPVAGAAALLAAVPVGRLLPPSRSAGSCRRPSRSAWPPSWSSPPSRSACSVRRTEPCRSPTPPSTRPESSTGPVTRRNGQSEQTVRSMARAEHNMLRASTAIPTP